MSCSQLSVGCLNTHLLLSGQCLYSPHLFLLLPWFGYILSTLQNLIYTNVSLSIPQSLFQSQLWGKKNVEHHDIAHFPCHLLKSILKQKESVISKAPSYLSSKMKKTKNKTKHRKPSLETEQRHLVEESSFCCSVTCVPTFAIPWTAPHQTFFFFSFLFFFLL